MSKFAGSMTLVVLFKSGERVVNELKYNPAKRGDFQRELADFGFHMWEGCADKIRSVVVVADTVYQYTSESDISEVLGLEG